LKELNEYGRALVNLGTTEVAICVVEGSSKFQEAHLFLDTIFETFFFQERSPGSKREYKLNLE
jgi:hypothetical protein